jgi:hypothetical protein
MGDEMSKSEEKTATGDAKNQNLQFNKNAQSSYNQAQTDIGDYEGQLAKYSAANPFVQGGQYQTAQTQQAADTAASGAQAAGQAMQAAAVRSGQNPASSIAATEQVSEANNRNLASDEAQQTQQRIGLNAGYNQNVLNATAVPEQMEAALNQTEAGAANSALGQEVDAAKTPSYLDELVQGGLTAGSAFVGKLKPPCWVAAKLWGGWNDTRVILLRLWLVHEFSQRWYGKLPCWLYSRYGERMADTWMTQHPALEWAMRKLFTQALRRASHWQKRVPCGTWAFVEYVRLEQKYREERIEDPKKFSDWAIGFAGRSF